MNPLESISINRAVVVPPPGVAGVKGCLVKGPLLILAELLACSEWNGAIAATVQAEAARSDEMLLFLTSLPVLG